MIDQAFVFAPAPYFVSGRHPPT